MATVDTEKVLLVSILSVLAFTASHSLPRAYNPASHEGQKVEGEEGGKQRVDSGTICTTDDTGQFTCLGIGYCAATGDHCENFYHCIPTIDGNYKRKNCTCQNGKIFSDGDPENPCVAGSCDNVFITNWQPLVSGNVDFVCDPVEETTTEVTTTVETTEGFTQGTTQEPTWGTTDATEWTRETTTETTTTATWSTVTASACSKVFTTPSPFECQTLGAFPDPEDCHAYYQCVIYPSGVMVAEHCTCDQGQYFDLQNFACEFGSCNPTQETTGTSGYFTGTTPQFPWTWTPYYTTTTQYFTGTTQSPMTWTPYYTTASQYFTGTTQHSTQETTTYSPFTCPDLGRFPDPEDCTSYYQCVGDSTGNIHADHVYCWYGYHFDVVDLLCEEGPCPTISSYFSTTSPFPTTTAFATESPFECPSLGSYPDPADCRKYFVCRGNSSGNIVASSEYCPEGTYFDPKVASCVYGDC
ncbi:uncharacterized protein LOC124159539 [Ischnura elegans]|uniref:uncharacterized protein LOC124159539 n=1 Tax=Ischnura elegans TaxID=197161 RepID=UPI001ED89DAA|nr:uncharacterized protein LOC124159539 [Ischnura elegans]